ncbi:MAG: dihydroorotate dehydrogenase electron transfer subunit [Oscillospiraceae bacterium]|nr:dihydroorotate dehydrogenase electron transfer subunit [Oscillospiraceae bacterium]
MATVLRVKHTSAACYLWLHTPEVQESKAGQFVMVKCDGFWLERPLGIASHEGEEMLLVFAVKGKGTKWLSARGMGDEIVVRGAFGNGFPQVHGRALLVGGGLGLPPLLYTAQEMDCDIACGFRNKESVILLSEFTDACRHVALATDDGSIGLHGNAINAAEQLMQKNDYATVFACGPHPLLRAVKVWAEEKKLPCWLSLEEHMACGIGACLVCACASSGTYKRVCKDGPVFAADEVDV